MDAAFGHFVVVRKKAKFLHRMMVELAGSSVISLEGDLSKCRFAECIEAPQAGEAHPTPTAPGLGLDFAVLKLTADAVEPVFKQIMAAGLEAIIHIQIARDGELWLGAYDNLHPECVFAWPMVSAALLERLKAEGLIHSFSPAKEPPPQ